MSLDRASWDVVVVGGGVIGCAVARAVASTGRTVAVVERGRPGSESSWAAAGMLSPLGEAPEPGPFLRLALESMAAWPDFASAVEEEGGVPLRFRGDGKLLVAFDEPQLSALAARRLWQEAEGFDVRWLDAAEARALEPAISPRVEGALLLPRDGQVDNRALGEGLWRAAEAAGCLFALGSPAEALLHRGGRVEGVRTAGGERFLAGTVVVAAGAWSGILAGLPRSLPIRPVRGQMTALRTEVSLLERVVAGPGAYLIPRGPEGGHRILVGASVEDVGFSRETTAATLEALRAAAVAVAPGLAMAEVVETWAGLRPATPDGLPVLGPDPDVRGLHYATGHFRNGILLAPATAARLARALDAPRLADDLAAFAPDRFAPSAPPG